MPWTDLASYRFHYKIQGAAHHPKLFFLHGFMGSRDEFDIVIAKVASAFCCLSVDLPGHGQTEVLHSPRGYRMEAIAEGLVELLTTLNFTPCFLVGYSMGGRLALYLAYSFPQQFTGVLLESACPGLATQTERTQRCQQDEQLARTLECGDWPSFLQKWYEQPMFTGLRQSPQFEVLIQKRWQNRPLELAQVLRDMGTGTQPSLWHALPALKKSVTLVTGALDPKFVHLNQLMMDRCPLAQLTVIPHCGHCIHHEAPNAFVDALEISLHRSSVAS